MSNAECRCTRCDFVLHDESLYSENIGWELISDEPTVKFNAPLILCLGLQDVSPTIRPISGPSANAAKWKAGAYVAFG